MSTLPIVVCIVEPKDSMSRVKEGLDLVQKIKEIEPAVVLELLYDVVAPYYIKILTSKSTYIKVPTLDTTVEVILKQQDYVNKKGK